MARGMKFGAGYQGTRVPEAIAAREQDLGYTLDSARYYMKWSEALVDDEVNETLALGKDAIIALESFDGEGVSYRWLDVADGKYDTRLATGAAELKALDPNGPTILSSTTTSQRTTPTASASKPSVGPRAKSSS